MSSADKCWAVFQKKESNRALSSYYWPRFKSQRAVVCSPLSPVNVRTLDLKLFGRFQDVLVVIIHPVFGETNAQWELFVGKGEEASTFIEEDPLKYFRVVSPYTLPWFFFYVSMFVSFYIKTTCVIKYMC